MCQSALSFRVPGARRCHAPEAATCGVPRGVERGDERAGRAADGRERWRARSRSDRCLTIDTLTTRTADEAEKPTSRVPRAVDQELVMYVLMTPPHV